MQEYPNWAMQPSQEPAKVLVIDDNEPRLAGVVRALEQAGRHVFAATTGAEGLALWEEHRPDLAWVDVVLPDMSGFDVCRLIKAEDTERMTQVILISSQMVSTKVQAEALENGADGYATYPMSVREVVARVSARLRLKESEDARRASDRRFRLLYRHMQEGMAIHEMLCDTEGNPIDYQIIDVNPAFTTALGIPRDRALSMPATELFGETIAPFIDTYGKVVQTGQSAAFDAYFEPMQKHFSISAFSWQAGMFATIFSDITERVQAEKKRESLIAQLQQALGNVKELSGLLPICSHCKKIRDDQGYWSSVEEYILDHSNAELTHSLCPGCIRQLYPDLADQVLGDDSP